MYGLKIAYVRGRKFSLVGWCIQLVEALHILLSERRLRWPPFYHVSIYDEHLGRWFDANDLEVKALTDKQFSERYLTIEDFEFDCEIDLTTRQWLLAQVGKRYSFKAIWSIYRKFKRDRIGLTAPSFVDGQEGYICTELVLRTLEKLNYPINLETIEVTSIEESYHIIRNL